MQNAIKGLHHVTAIAGSAQRNVDFYTGVLRQRLVKQTVNFDDPGTYHLYYGDADGAPGTIMTFFPFADAGSGRPGPGMASAAAYAVPFGALDNWMVRFAEAGIETAGPVERFGERTLSLADPDGLTIELVESERAQDGRDDDGFHSVTLWLANPEPTARLLTDVMGYEVSGEERDGAGVRLRLALQRGGRASTLDLFRSEVPAAGRPGAGTIHHIAFRASDDDEQLAWRAAVADFGLRVTDVIDRQYFNAIYFREPGGVLFEIATDPPGFAVDEAPADLGRALKLPPQYEDRRAAIEARLSPLSVPA